MPAQIRFESAYSYYFLVVHAHACVCVCVHVLCSCATHKKRTLLPFFIFFSHMWLFFFLCVRSHCEIRFKMRHNVFADLRVCVLSFQTIICFSSHKWLCNTRPHRIYMETARAKASAFAFYENEINKRFFCCSPL